MASGDLSAFFNEASAVLSVETAETTTFGASGGAKTYVTGHNDGTLSLSGLFDGDAGSVDEGFAALVEGDLSIPVIVSQGPPAVGRQATFCIAIETSYEVSSPVADVVSISVDTQAEDGIQRGVLLAIGAAITSTSNGSSVDGAAGTTNGGYAYLSVPANTRNGAVTVKVQHSADNSSWVDLVTFASITASTPTSERVAVAEGATVNRYLRATYTVAGSTGSISPVVGFARRN
jgi:hypothetical protein